MSGTESIIPVNPRSQLQRERLTSIMKGEMPSQLQRHRGSTREPSRRFSTKRIMLKARAAESEG